MNSKMGVMFVFMILAAFVLAVFHPVLSFAVEETDAKIVKAQKELKQEVTPNSEPVGGVNQKNSPKIEDIAKPGARPINEIGKGVEKQKNPYANADIITKIIPAANNTFGYDILVYDRPLIHQPHIPGLPGNEGFSTKEKAQKVADFVAKKIRNNEMPPTVTIDDLKKLEALK